MYAHLAINIFLLNLKSLIQSSVPTEIDMKRNFYITFIVVFLLLSPRSSDGKTIGRKEKFTHKDQRDFLAKIRRQQQGLLDDIFSTVTSTLGTITNTVMPILNEVTSGIGEVSDLATGIADRVEGVASSVVDVGSDVANTLLGVVGMNNMMMQMLMEGGTNCYDGTNKVADDITASLEACGGFIQNIIDFKVFFLSGLLSCCNCGNQGSLRHCG